MRILLVAALLAGVAAPALAARPNDEDRAERHHERSERTETKDSTPKQERNVERPQQRSFEGRSESRNAPEPRAGVDVSGRPRSVGTTDVQAVERVRSRDAGDSVREWRGRERSSAIVERHNAEPREVRAPREGSVERSGSDTVRAWRSRERSVENAGSNIEERNVRRAPGRSGGDLVQSRDSEPRVFERTERRISRRPVFGTEPPEPRTATAIGAKPAHHWRTDWRHDHRYDWRDYRHRHRSHFHLGYYYDPFGWDYMRYGVGWRLWPSYYRSSFWLDDPWQYRLPPAYGPYRWVRYFNDALLVNIYTGEVVDVEYNFFW